MILLEGFERASPVCEKCPRLARWYRNLKAVDKVPPATTRGACVLLFA